MFACKPKLVNYIINKQELQPNIPIQPSDNPIDHPDNLQKKPTVHLHNLQNTFINIRYSKLYYSDFILPRT
jgi:hypothetical protein